MKDKPDKKIIWPSPFFVGDEYKPGKGVLFIAQNPGWPHYRIKMDGDRYEELDDADYIEIYRNLERKYDNNCKMLRKDFIFIMQCFTWELRVDNVWRGIIKSGVEVKLKDIAFTNLVKCPTQDDKSIDRMIESCVNSCLIEEIKILKPAFIVFVGTKLVDENNDIYTSFRHIDAFRKIIKNCQKERLYHTSRGRWWKENLMSEKGKKVSTIIRRLS
ncbi:hypothetical protein KAX97_05170 [candidate division WOR-3 bacterium]|nr:hypothetical protein [candidate division WOR-3 bacterium]